MLINSMKKTQITELQELASTLYGQSEKTHKIIFQQIWLFLKIPPCEFMEKGYLSRKKSPGKKNHAIE